MKLPLRIVKKRLLANYKLNYLNNMNKHKKQNITPQQEKLLKDNFDKLTKKQLAEVLGVSEFMVGRWSKELGLKKTYTMHQDCETEFFVHDKNLATI